MRRALLVFIGFETAQHDENLTWLLDSGTCGLRRPCPLPSHAHTRPWLPMHGSRLRHRVSGHRVCLRVGALGVETANRTCVVGLCGAALVEHGLKGD